MEDRIAALEAQIASLQDTVCHLQSTISANSEGYALSTADGSASMVVNGNRASFSAEGYTVED